MPAYFIHCFGADKGIYLNRQLLTEYLALRYLA
jgi:hypothetical protein